MPMCAPLRKVALGALLSGCSAQGSLGSAGQRAAGYAGAGDHVSASPSTSSSNAAPPSGNGDSSAVGASGDDGEQHRASPPQLVTGAFLTSCANVAANGFGCTIDDSQTHQKAAAPFTQLRVTVTLQDGTSVKPALTPAAASDPWLVYFHLTALQVPEVASIRMEAVAADGSPYSSTASGAAIASQPPQLAVLPLQASVLFVTKRAYTPGVAPFNAIASIDTECETLGKNSSLIANAAKLNWMALLSADVADKLGSVLSQYVYKIAVTGDMYNTAGERVSLAAGLFGAHAARLVTDENGAYIGEDAPVWSGSTNSGALVTGSTCNSWTSSMGTATTGISSDPVNWLQSSQANCNQALRIYCLGSQ